MNKEFNMKKKYLHYRNDPKFSDRQGWANSVDQIRLLLEVRVYIVCHSICTFWMHYSTAKPLCSNFRVITAIFSSVRNFKSFTIIRYRFSLKCSYYNSKASHFNQSFTLFYKWHCSAFSPQSTLNGISFLLGVWGHTALCCHLLCKHYGNEANIYSWKSEPKTNSVSQSQWQGVFCWPDLT